MALCGFNEKMVKGLAAFNEGLVEHGLQLRSQKNGETVEQGIKRELSDMLRLLSELSRIEDSPKRILTEGLIRYVMGYYMIVRIGGVQNYGEIVKRVSDYFWYMDSTFYSELEGKPHDMEELASLLNKKVI